MSDRPVTLFMFAGRQGNLEVNLPLIRRILDENPGVQCDIWNLARDRADGEYLNTIAGDRIRVIHTFAPGTRRMYKVWQHYAQPRYRDHLFVKIDDDVVFIQTEKFGEFVDAIEANPDRVLSAEVVNNGACTAFSQYLWQGFLGLDIPLLDVHESNEYAQISHNFMIDNWRKLVGRPTSIVDIETWLSINFIGLDHSMLAKLAAQIGRRAPARIADRTWGPRDRIGDEGAANMFPRAVMAGFTVGHLGFGPQKLTEPQEGKWRADYAEIGREYLRGVAIRNILDDPAFDPDMRAWTGTMLINNPELQL